MIEPGAILYYDLIGTGYSFYLGDRFHYSADRCETFYAWHSSGYDYIDFTGRGEAIWDASGGCNLIMQ